MTVYLLAHGSADPRHAEDVDRIAARLGIVLGDVRACYLDHCGPTLSEAADVGGTVVPLLFSPGHHATVDVERAVASAAVPLAVADAPLLTAGAAWGADLLAETRRTWPGHQVVMVGAGTRDTGVLRAWQETSTRLGVPVAQASGPGPRLDGQMRAGRPVVLPLLVARGFFGDRIAAEAASLGVPVAEVAGSSEALLDELVRLARAATLRDPAGQPGRRHAIAHPSAAPADFGRLPRAPRRVASPATPAL